MSNPILVEVMRAGELESFHRGVICVVNKDGQVIYSQGDIEQVCYPRSALKLFQVLPLIESGAAAHYGFTREEIAIMCGSHNGEAEHLKVVSGILQKIGLDKESLKCGPQYPTLKKDFVPLYKADESPQHIHNNCSGKHAGFLAYCKFHGLDTATYLDPNHPLQKEILRVSAEMHEYPAEKMTIAVDGCSAPIFALPVRNQALGYKNLVHPVKFDEKRRQACAAVVEAVSAYPFMVAGTERYCTDMLAICGKRIIGKTGAEGIYSLGLVREGIGCTIKIDDGKMLPQYNVAQRFIEAAGIFDEATLEPLRHYIREELKNYNRLVTGEIRVKAGLFENLNLS